jgi:signal transduction histidine kinase
MPFDLKRSWETFFSKSRSAENRVAVSVVTALIGFGLTYWIYRAIGFYFTSMVIVTVILIALYGGGALGILFAVILSLAADYSFIPPVGTVLSSRAGWEHFAIIVSIALVVNFAGSSLRESYRQTILAKHAAEDARRGAQETSALMERMLALVSHDIRNPLATVKTASQLLFETSGSVNREQELRAMIARNLAQVDSMIQSLLDVARVRSGKVLRLELRACDLAAEVRTMVEEVSLGAGRRVELIAAEPVPGEWGVTEIRRAVQNLVSNAVKYGTPNTPIVIRLEREGEHALLSVHNEGPEIAAPDRELIFQPFQRTRATENGGVQGWGLGLALVQAIAEAHGGRVAIDSAAGMGATFTLDLPNRPPTAS